MTDSDKPLFAKAFAHLALALREQKPDAVVLRVYFETLRGCEIEFVVEAASRLMRASFFPKTGEWLRAVEVVERERREAQQALLRRLPEPLCPQCADTGWKLEGNEAIRCSCADQRYRELLGRAPWPALPPKEKQRDGRLYEIGPAEATSIRARVEQRTGLRIGIRTMPGQRPSSTVLSNPVLRHPEEREGAQ